MGSSQSNTRPRQKHNDVSQIYHTVFVDETDGDSQGICLNLSKLSAKIVNSNQALQEVIVEYLQTATTPTTITSISFAENRKLSIFPNPKLSSPVNPITALNLSSNKIALIKNVTPNPLYSNLTHLDLSHNFLTEFPLELANLQLEEYCKRPSLEVLKLSFNKISVLPNEIPFPFFNSIQTLDLSNNKLRNKVCRSTFKQMTCLSSLNLAGNNELEWPSFVTLQLGPEAIAEFMIKEQEQEQGSNEKVAAAQTEIIKFQHERKKIDASEAQSWALLRNAKEAEQEQLLQQLRQETENITQENMEAMQRKQMERQALYNQQQAAQQEQTRQLLQQAALQRQAQTLHNSKLQDELQEINLIRSKQEQQLKQQQQQLQEAAAIEQQRLLMMAQAAREEQTIQQAAIHKQIQMKQEKEAEKLFQMKLKRQKQMEAAAKEEALQNELRSREIIKATTLHQQQLSDIMKEVSEGQEKEIQKSLQVLQEKTLQQEKLLQESRKQAEENWRCIIQASMQQNQQLAEIMKQLQKEREECIIDSMEYSNRVKASMIEKKLFQEKFEKLRIELEMNQTNELIQRKEIQREIQWKSELNRLLDLKPKWLSDEEAFSFLSNSNNNINSDKKESTKQRDSRNFIKKLSKTTETEEKEENVDDLTMCKICMEVPINIVNIPCGHACSCKDCSKALSECPICRSAVSQFIQIFLV